MEDLHGNANYGCIYHSWMFEKKCLKLSRSNLVTLYLDEFLCLKPSLAEIATFKQGYLLFPISITVPKTRKACTIPSSGQQ